MKFARNIFLLLFLTVVLTGCSHTPFFGWFSNIFITDTDTGTDFVLDNDSVFDLFEDDFGTGTQYDDRFIEGGNGDLDVGDTDVSADGQVEYQPAASSTVDPAYDKVGKMTPAELDAIGTLQIPMLLLGGNEFPFPAKQFGELVGKDKCDHSHYHGASGFSLDLVDVPEPSNSCGFDNNVTPRTVTGHQMIDWFHNRPRNF